jgi:hypothetical protein
MSRLLIENTACAVFFACVLTNEIFSTLAKNKALQQPEDLFKDQLLFGLSEFSVESIFIIRRAHPRGIECSTEGTHTVLPNVQSKVFG